jgi:hypothetical protein
MIQFNLENNEAEIVVQIVGQLPTQSNAYPLYQKLKAQLKSAQQDNQSSTVVNTTDNK